MYDETGNEYLDCINNVAHGKCEVALFINKLSWAQTTCYMQTGVIMTQ